VSQKERGATETEVPVISIPKLEAIFSNVEGEEIIFKDR